MSAKLFKKTVYWDFEEFIIENNFSFSQQIKSIKKGICVNCRAKIVKIGEYAYILNGEVWDNLKLSRGFICVKCAEKQLGRKLNKNDFDWSAELNNDPSFYRSEQLINAQNRELNE